MKAKHYFSLMLVLSLMLATAMACGNRGGSDTEVAIAVALTQTAAALGQIPTATPIPAATPTPMVAPSPTPAPPTNTPPPPLPSPTAVPTPEPTPVRITFEPGGTSATVEDSVSAGGVKDYVIQALAGQTMRVFVMSPKNDVFLTIYGLEDGQPLVRSASEATSWTGQLPATQDYIIKAVSVGEATNYTLQVVIPYTIKFAPGGTSASVEGSVSARAVRDYIIRAMAGQTMMVSIDSPKSDVLLTIYGLEDGQPLVRSASGATSWTGQLPATQDYVIEAVSVGEATNYSLQVIIPYTIRFAPGGTSAVVEGHVAGGSFVRYLLRAMAGQTMTVNIISPNQDVLLTIYGLDDGQPLVRSVSGATSWTGVLPGTQDYVIDAVSVGGDAGVTLEVTVK